MALVTLGTAAPTTLQALRWNQGASVANPQDLAALNALIQYTDGLPPPPFRPQQSVTQGGIYWPSRGMLKLFEGDYIGVDPVTGQWILLTAAGAASASWVHT